ncbi:MAG TPA: class I SAM-dependent methyltransferase [bacterium]|nr:class I SAM-dependent methyltransferase [bacterium]
MERWFDCYMDIDKIQNSCLICGGGTRVVWKEKKYIARRCKRCDVIFCPPASNLTNLYDEKYFFQWYIKSYFKRKRYLQKLFSNIEKKITLPRGNLLDIGCGTGIFLELAKKRNFNITGLDISPFAVEHCKKRGFDVIYGDIRQAKFIDNYFDIVTMLDVIAHVDYPLEYLKSVNKILKDNGLIIIKTPVHSMFLFHIANLLKFTGKSKSLLHIPAQIFHFNFRSIRNLLFLAGFESVCVIQTRDLPGFFLSLSPGAIFLYLVKILFQPFFVPDSIIIIGRKYKIGQ